MRWKRWIFVRLAVFSGQFFSRRIHRISYKKVTGVHGFKWLSSCMSPTSYSTAPSIPSIIFPVNLREALKFERNNCKVCNFSGEKLFSPHSAGIGEKFSFTAKNSPLKLFFSPNSSHWEQILYFYTNSPQIWDLLAIFSGGTSTRELMKAGRTIDMDNNCYFFL